MVSKDQHALFFRCQVCFLCNKPTICLATALFLRIFDYMCKKKVCTHPPWGLAAKIKRFAPPPPLELYQHRD